MDKSIDIYIPDSISELNIANVMVFNKVMKIEGLSDVEKVVQVIANLNDLDVNDVRKLPANVIDEIGSKIITLFSADETEYSLKNLKSVMIDGVKYGLEPSFSKMETGAYIDITSLLEDLENNLHKLMAILYRPIKRQYGLLYELTEYSIEPDDLKIERENLFLAKMPYNIVRALVNFLLSNMKK